MVTQVKKLQKLKKQIVIQSKTYFLRQLSMKGKSISMLPCSGVDAFHLWVSGRRGEVDLKRRLCFRFSYLPKTMLLFVVCHLARLFLRRWWWGRQLQLEDAPYSSVMTSANSNITRSGLPLKEKTSFLLNNKKTIICDKLLCDCHSFLTMRVKRVTLFYAPSPLLLSLSCEVLCQSKRSRRENFIRPFMTCAK